MRAFINRATAELRKTQTLQRPWRVGVLAVALALVGAEGGSWGADPRNKPNILFILADDLGYADLGCYGQKAIQTPHIDRLAAEGMRFTQAYAGAAVCAPSRCALLTGRHMGHARVRENHGIRNSIPPSEQGQKNRIPLEPEDVTVAKVLKTVGYSTTVFGKWGLGEPRSTGVPTRQGFDEWFGFLNQDDAEDYYSARMWQNEAAYAVPGNENEQRQQYVHGLFTDRALAFIRNNRGRPFFLYLAYTLPHKKSEVPALGQYAGKPWTDFEKTYAAMVTRLDRDVGQIMRSLLKFRLDERTIVFFSSDNGAPAAVADSRFRSAGNLRGRKGSLYEGGLRVPMIVRWPGHVPAGVVSSQVWYFADFLPTAAEVAGASPPPGLDGLSLLPTLLGREQDLATRFLYWENPKSQAVRQGNWKLIRPAPRAPPELYDLSQDALAQNNLASARQDVRSVFEEYLVTSSTPSPNYPREH